MLMYISIIPHYNFDFTMNKSMKGDKNYIQQS